MTLEQYVRVLNDIQHAPYSDELYTNTNGIAGYIARYRVGFQFYWYSVSDVTKKVSPSEVAEAISKGYVTRQGQFKVNGFEATVSCDGHWYMLNMGSDEP
jgi:hypothetical protein